MAFYVIVTQVLHVDQPVIQKLFLVMSLKHYYEYATLFFGIVYIGESDSVLEGLIYDCNVAQRNSTMSFKFASVAFLAKSLYFFTNSTIICSASKASSGHVLIKSGSFDKSDCNVKRFTIDFFKNGG